MIARRILRPSFAAFAFHAHDPGLPRASNQGRQIKLRPNVCGRPEKRERLLYSPLLQSTRPYTRPALNWGTSIGGETPARSSSSVNQHQTPLHFAKHHAVSKKSTKTYLLLAEMTIFLLERPHHLLIHDCPVLPEFCLPPVARPQQGVPVGLLITARTHLHGICLSFKQKRKKKTHIISVRCIWRWVVSRLASLLLPARPARHKLTIQIGSIAFTIPEAAVWRGRSIVHSFLPAPTKYLLKKAETAPRSNQTELRQSSSGGPFWGLITANWHLRGIRSCSSVVKKVRAQMMGLQSCGLL
jgi:hypothetical protein